MIYFYLLLDLIKQEKVETEVTTQYSPQLPGMSKLWKTSSNFSNNFELVIKYIVNFCVCVSIY